MQTIKNKLDILEDQEEENPVAKLVKFHLLNPAINDFAVRSTGI